MSTTINKNIFDITTLHNGSSVDVVTAGVTSSGQPELDIGNAALVNDSSDNLKLNGRNILTGENVALSGEGAPTTSTIAEFIGQTYINIVDNSIYVCTNITTVGSISTYNWSSPLPVTIDYTR